MKFVNALIVLIVTIFCINSFALQAKPNTFDPLTILKAVSDVCALPELEESYLEKLKSEEPKVTTIGYATEGCGKYEYIKNNVILKECGDRQANWTIFTVTIDGEVFRARGSYNYKNFSEFFCF